VGCVQQTVERCSPDPTPRPLPPASCDAVDREGEEREADMQLRWSRKAAKKFLRMLLKVLQYISKLINRQLRRTGRLTEAVTPLGRL
jgi:hypothetical protein